MCDSWLNKLLKAWFLWFNNMNWYLNNSLFIIRGRGEHFFWQFNRLLNAFESAGTPFLYLFCFRHKLIPMQVMVLSGLPLKSCLSFFWVFLPIVLHFLHCLGRNFTNLLFFRHYLLLQNVYRTSTPSIHILYVHFWFWQSFPSFHLQVVNGQCPLWHLIVTFQMENIFVILVNFSFLIGWLALKF